MSNFFKYILFALVLLLSAPAPRGVEAARVAIDLDKPFSGYALTAAFPGVYFNHPVCLATPPGETNRLFVLEREGVICVITNLARPTRSVFLDLKEQTFSDNIEAGLLGLAFHPGFATNGQFFVFRTMFAGRLTDRLARFSVSANDPNQGNPESEVVLIDQADLLMTHNGGDLRFGPDGYLYFSVGDEGPTLPDRSGDLQSIEGGLFAGVFRIDVDQRPGNPRPNPHPSVVGNYSIPADNPFVGITSFLDREVDPTRVRTEFYAYGMRNPWRFTFDELTGELVAGDVGSGQAEEVNLIVKGGNYGWPYWEANYPTEHYAPPELGIGPIHWYDRGRGRAQGSCVIGGVVCRNSPIADLEGWYVFADEGSGNIWKLRTSELGSIQWIAREPGLVAFGRDPATGDVLAASLMRGEIRRLIYVPPEEERVPTLLSATGVFSELVNLTPASGIVPFEINAPFWSDNAIKSRWFGLINPAERIGFAATSNWTFPHGAVWVKHFDLEMEKGNPATARRIETRVLVKAGEAFQGFTYRWDEDQREARLVPSEGLEETFEILDLDSGVARTQWWIYPSRGDCAACHTQVGGGALGFHTAQLNRDVMRDGQSENQIQRLARMGYLDLETIQPGDLPRLAQPGDTAEPLEFRVKSYLASNCSQCHQPGGIWAAEWDARWSAAMSEANIVGTVAHSPLNAEGSMVIAPGSLTNSMMFRRLTEQGQWRMPPIGSTVLDSRAREMLEEWILGMPSGEFQQRAVGEGALRGSLTQRGGVQVLSGVGAGLRGSSGDRYHFLGRALRGNGHVVARIASVPGARAGMKAGVMVRDATTDAATAWLARGVTGRNILLARSDLDAEAGEVDRGRLNGAWMRLVRNGNRVAAWESNNGVDWQSVGESDFIGPTEAMAGVAVASGEDWRFATAEFDELRTLSLSLRLIDPAPNLPLPRDVTLEAAVESNGGGVARVDFLADGHLIGSVSAAPFRMLWTNAWAGTYNVVAVAVDQAGLAVPATPVVVNFAAGPSLARFLDSSDVTADWRERYGALGQAIPVSGTSLPARASLAFEGATAESFSDVSVLPGLPAAAWVGRNNFSISYRPADEVPHRLSLFLAPYGNGGAVNITMVDPTGEIVLNEYHMDQPEGAFVSWAVRGPLEIYVSSESDSAGVSGLFLDPLAPPAVRLLPIETPIRLPASVLLQGEAWAEGREIRRVEFWDGATKVGEDTEAPYEVRWENPLAGEHSLTVWAVGEYGLGARSEPVVVTCSLPPPTAVFVGEDRFTQGDWIGAYGNSGHVLVTGWTNLPPELNFAAMAGVFPFAAEDERRSALERIENESRFAGCYYSLGPEGLEMRITTMDGNPRRVGLYLLDWGNSGRAQKVSLFDAASQTKLTERNIESFSEGTYVLWNIRGDLKVTIQSLNDFNSVVSAIFFDPPESAAGIWWRQRFPDVGASEENWRADPDQDGRANLLEYAAASDPLAADEPIIRRPAFVRGQFELVVSAGTPPADARIALESSSDLLEWTEAEAIRIEVTDGIRFRTSADEGSPRFFRLRAELLDQ